MSVNIHQSIRDSIHGSASLETVVALGTAMLCSVFVLAAVLPPIGHAIIG